MGALSPPVDDLADTSEFASDVELPLSDDDEHKTKPEATAKHPAPADVRHTVLAEEPKETTKPRPSVSAADMTLEGLCNLLAAVQDTFEGAFVPEEYYRDQMPPATVRKDVISNANRGSSLSHKSGESMSMIILDQLPLFCAHLEGSCLIPDDFLSSAPESVTVILVKAKVAAGAKLLWEKLHDHFVQMMKYGIMQAGEIAGMFSPLLIAQGSPYGEQAQQILRKVLENVPSEELQPSPVASGTDSSDPESPGQNAGTGAAAKEPVVVPRVEADEPQPPATKATVATATQPQASIPLTQTAAYRQLLGDTASTQRTLTYEDSDEDSADSVEQALKAHSLATTPRSELMASTPASTQSAPAATTVVPTGGFSFAILRVRQNTQILVAIRNCFSRRHQSSAFC